MSAKPSFYGSTAWPSIGPDVSGGTISNVGGHVKRIPARICFEDVMGGTFSDATPKTFNANLCYATVGGGSSSGSHPSGGVKMAPMLNLRRGS